MLCFDCENKEDIVLEAYSEQYVDCVLVQWMGVPRTLDPYCEFQRCHWLAGGVVSFAWLMAWWGGIVGQEDGVLQIWRMVTQLSSAVAISFLEGNNGGWCAHCGVGGGYHKMWDCVLKWYSILVAVHCLLICSCEWLFGLHCCDLQVVTIDLICDFSLSCNAS